MSTQTTRTLFQAAALIGLVLSPASAMAYDFYESCAPTTNHETTLDTADVLIILDKSGSMGGDGDSNGNSKMLLAQQSIEEVSNSTFRDGPCNEMDQSGCDLVRLGLGYFSGGSNVNIIPQERDAGNEDIITDQVYNYSPGGGTYIGKAAKEIHDSNELDDTDRIGIGVIISDGQASSNGTVEQALYYLCEARNRANGPVQTFQVGFGAGADPEMNALFAAAGGTGQCCQGDGCDPEQPGLDPLRSVHPAHQERGPPRRHRRGCGQQPRPDERLLVHRRDPGQQRPGAQGRAARHHRQRRLHLPARYPASLPARLRRLGGPGGHARELLPRRARAGLGHAPRAA